MDPFTGFPFREAGRIAGVLLERAYAARPFVPPEVGTGHRTPGERGEGEGEHPAPGTDPLHCVLPEEGAGLAGLARDLDAFVAGSAPLASPEAMGHMDSAPHPGAAIADALVSAVNNNLLFRELSPFASAIEEAMVVELAARLGLVPAASVPAAPPACGPGGEGLPPGEGGDDAWVGTFTSGGSLANLTALFAATGGFPGVGERGSVHFFAGACAHASITKAAAVLGVPPERIHRVESDAQGRADPAALADALDRGRHRAGRAVVVVTFGSTVHGALEDLPRLVEVGRAAGAWVHVDAVYGGALAFSRRHRRLLAGIERADSVAFAPQKWLWVPRLSALVWVRGRERFRRALEWPLPYSVTGAPHRGQWGLQGSRRADAVTLWATLRCVGTGALGSAIDRGIEQARLLHRLLEGHRALEPTHDPDLNVQCLRLRRARGDDALRRAHHALTERAREAGVPWVSLARWGEQALLRCVLLAPGTGRHHLEALLEALDA